jgi:hypothetical protein
MAGGFSGPEVFSDIQSAKSRKSGCSEIFSDIETELSMHSEVESEFICFKPCFFGLYVRKIFEKTFSSVYFGPYVRFSAFAHQVQLAGLAPNPIEKFRPILPQMKMRTGICHRFPWVSETDRLRQVPREASFAGEIGGHICGQLLQ